MPHRSTLRTLAGSAGLALLVTPTLAQVQSLALVYQSLYTQGGPNPPTVTADNSFSAYFAPGPQELDEFVDVELTDPFGFVYPLTNYGGGFYQSDTFVAPTRGGLMAAWPAGDYEFRAIDGVHSGETYTMAQTYGLGLWPDQVPAFTPATYAALNQMDPSLPRTLAVNQFIPSSQADATTNGYYINRREPGGHYGAYVSSELSGGPILSSRTIPANTLSAQTDYYVTWIFSHRVETFPGGGIGYTYTEFSHTTRVPFTTGTASGSGCAADMGSQGGVEGGDGQLDNNDFIVYINYFFQQDVRADVGVQGGEPGSDGEWNNNDFIAFIGLFFEGC